MVGCDDNHRHDRVGQLLAQCQDRLLARIRWMMGAQARRLAESQDFLGEVTARILAKADSLHWHDADHFLALASRIARNLIVDQVRRPRVRRFESFTQSLAARDVADGETPSRVAAEGENIENVLAALERLSADDQRVIELRDFEDLPFKTIGERTGRTVAAAQIQHARAIIKLGRALS